MLNRLRMKRNRLATSQGRAEWAPTRPSHADRGQTHTTQPAAITLCEVRAFRRYDALLLNNKTPRPCDRGGNLIYALLEVPRS
jgi:hypothetical protein